MYCYTMATSETSTSAAHLGAVLNLVATGGSKFAPKKLYSDQFVEFKGRYHWNTGDFLVAMAMQLEDVKMASITTPTPATTVTMWLRNNGNAALPELARLVFQPVKFSGGIVHICILREPLAHWWYWPITSFDCIRSFGIARFVYPHNVRIVKPPPVMHIEKPLSVTHTHKMGPRPAGYFSSITWESHKTSVDAHGFNILSFRDQLSSDVLQYMCGGRRVFHTGPVALPRYDNYKISGPLRSSL